MKNIRKDGSAPAIEDLVTALSACLADATIFYHRVHGFHWNIVGPDFPQWHAKFEEIYEDVYGSLDPIAENIRKIGAFSPFTLLELAKMTSLTDELVTDFRSTNLVNLAYDDNAEVLASLASAFQIADSLGEQGIANFLAERIDAHQKWAWQLSASLAG